MEVDTKMFKVVQVLYTKHQRVHFVHGKQGQYVSQPQQSSHSVKWRAVNRTPHIRIRGLRSANRSQVFNLFLLSYNTKLGVLSKP